MSRASLDRYCCAGCGSAWLSSQVVCPDCGSSTQISISEDEYQLLLKELPSTTKTVARRSDWGSGAVDPWNPIAPSPAGGPPKPSFGFGVPRSTKAEVRRISAPGEPVLSSGKAAAPNVHQIPATIASADRQPWGDALPAPIKFVLIVSVVLVVLLIAVAAMAMAAAVVVALLAMAVMARQFAGQTRAVTTPEGPLALPDGVRFAGLADGFDFTTAFGSTEHAAAAVTRNRGQVDNHD